LGIGPTFRSRSGYLPIVPIIYRIFGFGSNPGQKRKFCGRVYGGSFRQTAYASGRERHYVKCAKGGDEGDPRIPILHRYRFDVRPACGLSFWRLSAEVDVSRISAAPPSGALFFGFSQRDTPDYHVEARRGVGPIPARSTPPQHKIANDV